MSVEPGPRLFGVHFDPPFPQASALQHTVNPGSADTVYDHRPLTQFLLIAACPNVTGFKLKGRDLRLKYIELISNREDPTAL